MATVQGICKNCGSLIMFDDRDKDCECVFCNCIFPSAEALALYENSDGHEFLNEKFEKSTENKHFYSTRVYSDDGLNKAIANDEISRSRKNDSKIKPSDFEVSPNDVKAPLKLVMALIAAIAVFVILVIVIAYPAYTKRVQLKSDISSQMNKVFDGVDGDFSIKTDAGEELYSISGQNCQNMTIMISGSISEEDALVVYENYSQIQSENGGKDSSDIEVKIYCDNGIYSIADGSAVLTENEV